MSNKKSGASRENRGGRDPSKSGIKKNGAASAQNKPPVKRKRGKNELDIYKKYNSSDEVYATQREFDRGAENILKKERRTKEPDQYSDRYSDDHSGTVPPAKAPSSPRVRKIKRVLFYIVTILVLVVICALVSLTVFFKIDSIQVEGKIRYESDEIISASMIKQGDNFILCKTSPGEREIYEKFPYIEEVDIYKKLFNKIIIRVKEATPTSIIESEGRYILLSESGKIIDISTDRQCNVPIILGARLEKPKLSSSVKYQDENIKEYIDEMIACAEKYDIGTLETIDISNLSKIVLKISRGLSIVIGTPENIDYKLKTASKIMDQNISANDKGILDVSLAATEGGKSYFNSESPDTPKQESSKKEESKQESVSEPEESSGEQTSEEEISTDESSDDESSDDENSDEESSEESPDEESTDESSDEDSDLSDDESSDEDESSEDTDNDDSDDEDQNTDDEDQNTDDDSGDQTDNDDDNTVTDDNDNSNDNDNTDEE